jgi:tetratricopeptide (TPR) repeat protein
VKNPPSPIEPVWQRWNDYGIGLLLEGATKGGQKGELKQAEEVFRKVADFGQADGWVNLARVYQREGRIPDALAALEKAANHEPKPAAPWVINWLTGQINASNGELEAAIKGFEAVLATRIPERKIDLGIDFLVLNDLGRTQYARARIEPVKSPERKEWLKKTVATFRRTLAVDSEDFDAHYGLGLALGDPAWGERPAAPGEVDQAVPVDPDELRKLAAAIADPKASPAERKERSLKLAGMVGRFMRGERPRYQSRLEPLHDLSEILGPVWEREADPDSQAALGRALEITHKSLHERLKPDETAEGRAFAIARKNDPAANMNAQSIVIHPLHRPGAPGIDAVPAAAEAASAAPTTHPLTSNPAHAQESGE